MSNKSKECKRCGVVKNATLFWKNKKMKDGRLNICVECCKKQQRKYYHKNREMLLEQKKQHRIDNIEKYKEKDKKYVKTHRAEVLERGRLYYEKNKKKLKSKQKERRKLNNSPFEESTRKSRKKFPEKVLARRATREALRKGIITKPKTCSNCGVCCKVQAHHKSYEKKDWLCVEWLCSKCHGEVHRERLNHE